MKKIFFYTVLICAATAYGASLPPQKSKFGIKNLKQMVSENIAKDPQLLKKAKKLPALLKKPVLEAEIVNRWIVEAANRINKEEKIAIINLTNYPIRWGLYSKTIGFGENEKLPLTMRSYPFPPTSMIELLKNTFKIFFIETVKRPKPQVAKNKRLLVVFETSKKEEINQDALILTPDSEKIPETYKSLSQYKEDHPGLLAVEIDLGSNNKSWDFVVFRQNGPQIQYKTFTKDELIKEFGFETNESN